MHFSQDSGTPTIPSHTNLIEIGRGGMGVIYKATQIHLGRVDAIKVIKPEAAAHDDAKERFFREMKAVGQLHHDHIVRAIDAQQTSDGTLYLVLEYVPGQNLEKYVKAKGPLPASEACDLASQTAAGLQYAHEKGFIHRDIKPNNLMRTEQGQVKILDFGLALAKSRLQPQLTRCGVFGTRDFMAPEQETNAHAVDVRADVFSLGVTLFFLLTQTTPKAARRRLQDLRPDLPGALSAILERMLDPKPANRFQTAREVATALAPFASREQSTVPLPAPPKRRRVGWLVAAAAGLLLAAMTVAWMLHGRTWWGGRTDIDSAVLGPGPEGPVAMSGHAGYCSSLVFTPDGLHALSESGGGGIYLWDLRKRVLQKSLLHGFEQPERNQDVAGAVTVAPDSKYFAAAPLNAFPRDINFFSLYDLKTFDIVKKDFATSSRMGHAVVFSPDSSKLATVELPGLFGLPSGFNVVIGIVPTGERWTKFSIESRVNDLAFSPDGEFLATGCEEQTIRLWRLQPHRLERQFRGHEGAVSLVGFSTDGTCMFSSSNADGTLRLWKSDRSAGEVVEKELIKIDAEKNVAKMLCAAFSPAGRALTGHKDGHVVLWDLTTGTELYRSRHEATQVTAVAISPDGHHALAALSNRLVYLHRLPPPR